MTTTDHANVQDVRDGLADCPDCDRYPRRRCETCGRSPPPRAVVRPCDEPDGTRTWDVEIDGRCVAQGFRTRALARAEARSRNAGTENATR